MAAGTPIDPKHRLPWAVAGCAILFAVVVLVRSELNPMQREHEIPISPVPGGVAGFTPAVGAPTPVSPEPVVPTVDLPPPQPLPVQTPIPTAIPALTAAPSPTPSPTITPSPTPQPEHVFEGLVTDANGQPVEGATISGTIAEGTKWRTLNAQSDSAGRFHLEGLRADEIDLLTVEAVGYGRSVVERIPLPLPDPLEIALTALAGLDIGVEVVDSQGGNPKLFSGQADFILLQKRTAAEATTQTLGLREALVAEGTFVPVAEQRITVSDGRFRLEEVEPGDYKAALRAGNQYAESAPVKVRQSGGRSVTTVSLGRTWPLRGRVVAETEEPVPGARVKLTRRSPPALYVETGPHAAQANDKGRFTLEKVPPGTYLATVAAVGFTTTTYPLEVSLETLPDETSFTLGRKSPSIHVTVRSADGSPITDARLVLLMTDPTTKTIFSKTDQAGTSFFDRLSPGKYTLSVTAPESRSRQKTLNVNVHDGEAHELEVAFPRTVRVLGTARQGGKPYQGLLKFSLRGAVGLESMVKTDDQGGYAIDLEPGEYMVGSPEIPNAQVVVVRSSAQPRTDVEVK